MNYENRIKRFLHLLKDSGSAGAIIAPGPNLYYLAGISPSATLERLFVLIISSNEESTLIIPKLYENELRESWIEDIVVWKDGEDPFEIFRKFILERFEAGEEIFVDDNIPASHLIKALDVLRQYELKPLGPIISKLRIIKDDEELENLRRAADIVDKVFYRIISSEIKGKSERDVSILIENLIKELGAELAFEPIVASGMNGANPHHRSSNKKIQTGDAVILDYGAKFNGYCSDITRTIFVGEPSAEFKKVYEIVKEAQERAYMVVKEGIMAKYVDLEARKTIENYGFGEYFIHRTGHGLGLDIHEEPYIVSSNETVLKNGMVFTIEPGIYIPNKFGIRIEDDVALIEGKGIRLTKAERELFVI